MLLSSRGRATLATALSVGASLLGPGAAPAHPEEVPAPPAARADEEPGPTSHLIFRAFGNIDWLSRRADVPDTFSVGQLDLFATSELTDDVSVLAEIVLEADYERETQVADVERFQVRYAPLDAVNVSLGRMHTVLGYWNQTYHHGAWLQTTAFRPEVYRWEDEEGGGLLPVHEVGLRLSGAVTTSPLRIEYSGSVANGRGVVPEDVVTVQDPNRSKAVSLWLGLVPKGWPGPEIGGTAHFDTIPVRPGDPRRESELGERILGAFLAFRRSNAEVIAEAFDIRHEDERTGESYRSAGLYMQGAWSIGRVKPYYRFDLVDRDESDPYYHDVLRDLRKHTLGVRFDPWERLAVKLEGSRADPGSGESYNAAVVQVAFTF